MLYDMHVALHMNPKQVDDSSSNTKWVGEGNIVAPMANGESALNWRARRRKYQDH